MPAMEKESGGVGIARVTLRTTLLRQYRKLEATVKIRGWNGPNPFDEEAIQVFGVISRPDGTTVSVPGFYYQPFKRDDVSRTLTPSGGAPTWKIRYTPTRKGAHSITFHLVTPLTHEISGPHAFRVIEARQGEQGFVRIHPKRKSYFQLSHSKKTYFPIGYSLDVPNFAKKKVIGPSSRYNALWGDGTYTPLEGATPSNLYKTLKIYEEAISSLAAAGGNSVRLRADSRFLPLELKPVDSSSDQDIAGWLDGGGVPGFDIGRYHQGVAWIMDRAFTLAEQNGIRIQFCTWNENQSSWIDFYTKNGNEPFIKRRLKYQVARWGYSPSLMSWELFNEATVKEIDIRGPFWSGIVEWLRATSPNEHPINNSYVGIDYDEKHKYIDHIEDFLSYVAFNRTKDRPLLLSEFGKKEYYLDPVETDPKGYKAHEGLWASLMRHWSGGWYWWFYPHVYSAAHSSGTDLYESIFKGISLYLDGEDLASHAWKQARLDRVSGPGGFASAGGMIGSGTRALLWLVRTPSSRYVDRRPADGNVYEVKAGGSEGGFRAGAYTVEWWDTWSGKIISVEHGVGVTAGGIEVRVPDGITRDVAAKVILEQSSPQTSDRPKGSPRAHGSFFPARLIQ